jgi:hypothetical protein
MVKVVSYWANWMGPINKTWCDKNGPDWASGRIDISGVPGEPWGLEYNTPLMRKKDFAQLSEFLDSLETKELLSREEVYKMYEDKYGPIEYFKGGC